MSLESLTNPLERLGYLPTAMQMRPSDFPPSSSYAWSASIQYYLNDVAISGVDGAAYVYTGGADQITCILGGSDPSASANWTLLGGAKATKIIPVSAGPAVNALTLSNHTLVVPANSKWLVHVHGLVSIAAGNYANTDDFVIGVTSSGTGGLGEEATFAPAPIPSTQFHVANSFYVEAGTTTSTLAITASGSGTSQNWTGIVAAFIRLA